MTIVKNYKRKMQFDERKQQLRRLVAKYGLFFDYRGYDDMHGWCVHTKDGVLMHFGIGGDKNVICIRNFYLKPDSVVEILERGYEDVAKEIQDFLTKE